MPFCGQGAEFDSLKAVILVGGPSTTTSFRPLCLASSTSCTAKPLYSVCGEPLLFHQISWLVHSSGGKLSEVLILGFFPSEEFDGFCSETSKRLVKCRYLYEQNGPKGTAGGLGLFANEIGLDNAVLVLNADSLCKFNLSLLLSEGAREGSAWELTMVTCTSPLPEGHKLGAVVVAPEPDGQNGCALGKVVHFAEKPDSYISKTINCGAYLMKPSALQRIVAIQGEKDANAPVSIELDLIPQLMLEAEVPIRAFSKVEFWAQVKTPKDLLHAASLLIRSSGQGANSFVHPSATVHPTAKVGDNVCIEAYAEIGPRVCLKNAIVAQGCEIGESAYLANCIIGEGSKIGRWTRIQEGGEEEHSLSVLAGWNEIEPETVIRGCLVLPHKQLSGSVFNRIIM